MSEGLRQTLWADMMALFHIPEDTKLKRLFLSSLADRFKDFKSKLVTGWITGTRKRSKKEENRMLYQVYKHIKEEDLAMFVRTSPPQKHRQNETKQVIVQNKISIIITWAS